ncbi:hypothetical protein HG264_14070 [Pseudomonas sp. gcc21]|uniref:hypothetical protein n=1 Tax=Pseudomonas sp. gcc21 TaxID=2726989 RepID=UPI00145157CF|nr:hypothetical protein [Pseudomonas sp. gcc21]QJD59946.1 hypothetical protein HG264_14070 [Pseudomonas sp. gcc21]
MHANKLNAENDGDTGGVLTEIVGSSPCATTVQQIERILGIDRDFPAALNLVEKLLGILQVIPVKDGSVLEWVRALESVQDAGKLRKYDLSWTRLAATSLAGNPLGGKFKRYPLPAFLLQEPLAELGEQANLIHRLFLEVAIQQKTFRGIQAIADELRKLIAISTPKSSMGRLPTDVSTDWSAWAEYLANLPANDALSGMLNKLLRLRTSSSSPTSRQTPPVSLISQTDSNPPSGVGISVGPTYRTLVTEPGDSQTAEPPKYVDLHLTPQEEEEDEPTSEQEVDAQCRETRHWISRHQRLTPNDSGRLTPIERRWLASRLRELTVSEDVGLRSGAGIVALMYVTGMPLDDVLQAAVGPEGTFDVGGAYRRTIRLPSNAYTPNADVAEQFLPRETTLVLQLPDMVTNWMNANVQHQDCALAQALGVELNKAKEDVDKVMECLRAGGRYTRIRRERIPAALAIELNLRYRDFGVVHHLASGPDQVAPMISYYVVHFIDDLKHRYTEVTEDMLRV